MTIQPLNGHVLLRAPDAHEATTPSGLVLPGTAHEATHEGVVEAMPPGGSDEVAVGDRVLYRPHAGEELSLEGRSRRLVPIGDLLAKVVEVDAIPA
jgi:chaperonin GroES